jgi:myosin-heavy-chain kinase
MGNQAEDENTALNDLMSSFSHFTYVASKKKLLVVDLQGVGHKLTDPTILSVDETEFGLGNVGNEGITNFFEKHKCNQLCSKLITADDKLKEKPQLLPSRRKKK